MTRPFSRRTMMGGMTALYALALARIAAAQSPLPVQTGPIGPDAFMDLSRRITGHDDLSPAFGARIFDVLTDNGQTEPLQTLYATVSGAASDMPLEDREILRHVLHGWYLGRITLDDEIHLTGFEETLMGRVTADILPLRSYCGGQMGFWSDPPATGPLPLREAPP